MAMNSDAASKQGGSSGAEMAKRVTAVETRLGASKKAAVYNLWFR